MQISLVDDELQVEIKVNPSHVGLLKPGLLVSIRFDASIYRPVSDMLPYISPDTLSKPGSNGQQ